MLIEDQLREQLRKVEALFLGATTAEKAKPPVRWPIG